MIKNKELHNIMKITVDTREIVPVFDRVGPIFEPTPGIVTGKQIGRAHV